MRPSAGKSVIKSADNGYGRLGVAVPLGGRGEYGECHAAFAPTGPGGHLGVGEQVALVVVAPAVGQVPGSPRRRRYGRSEI
jgi:hypothetical protein